MKSDPRESQHLAAEWIERRARGLNAEEARALARWLEEPRHRQAYAALERTWIGLDGLRHSKHAREFEREARQLEAPKPRRRALQLAWSGLAAAIVLAGAVGLGWRHMRAHGPVAKIAATEVGGSRSLELPDGSVLRLNTDSVVEVAYTQAERRVRLVKGEVLFSVAKQAGRAFVVEALGVDVRAIGTEFNLRLRATGLELLVTEGRVSVGGTKDPAVTEPVLVAKGPATFVSAGERLMVPPPEQRVAPVAERVIPETLTPTALARAVAWKDRRLVFAETSLAEIASDFNRYNRRKLDVADPELAARQFEGTFAVGETEAFVALLVASYHVVVEETPDQIVLRLARDEHF